MSDGNSDGGAVVADTRNHTLSNTSTAHTAALHTQSPADRDRTLRSRNASDRGAATSTHTSVSETRTPDSSTNGGITCSMREKSAVGLQQRSVPDSSMCGNVHTNGTTTSATTMNDNSNNFVMSTTRSTVIDMTNDDTSDMAGPTIGNESIIGIDDDATETIRASAIEEIDEDDAPLSSTATAVVTVNGSSNCAIASSSTALVGLRRRLPEELSIEELDDVRIQQVMLQLAAKAEHMKQRVAEHEAALAREIEFVAHLEQEHTALRALAKEYKYRARLRKRVARVEREATKRNRSSSLSSSESDSNSDTDSDPDDSDAPRRKSRKARSRSQSRSRSSGKHKRQVAKKCRLLQDARRNVTQELELLKAKNRNYEMEIERQLTELRREHEANFFLM